MHSTTWPMFSRGQWPFHHREVEQACDRTAARLERAGLEYLVGFFAALTARFARWTVDLPASERHHHAFPFGLLIHSIETVERAIAVGMETLNPFPIIWVKVTVALALLHDCGRLFDVEVTNPATREVWNPLEHPLHLFRETRFLPLTGGDVRWRSGRGIRAHEYRSLDLYPLLLPEDPGMEIKGLMVEAWRMYFGRHWRGMLDDSYPYAVAQIVACADQLSVQADRQRKRSAVAAPAVTGDAPVPSYSPKPGTRTAGPLDFPQRRGW